MEQNSKIKTELDTSNFPTPSQLELAKKVISSSINWLDQEELPNLDSPFLPSSSFPFLILTTKCNNPTPHVKYLHSNYVSSMLTSTYYVLWLLCMIWIKFQGQDVFWNMKRLRRFLRRRKPPLQWEVEWKNL